MHQNNFNQLLNIVNQYIDNQVYTEEPNSLYKPINYIFSAPGKRIRPVLLLMAYNIFSEDIEKALPASFAIELFHNFSLMHDDIMDNADVRRGQPSVHKKFDINTAILSGDNMLILSFQNLLAACSSDQSKEVLSLFADVSQKVCEGQQYDMDFEQRTTISQQEYLKMIFLKTGILLSGSLKIGAMLAGASEEAQNSLFVFGKAIGISFQLQDDILDLYGDPDLVGKQPGGDVIQCKKTILYTMTLAKLTEKEKGTFIELYNSLDEVEKVSKVKLWFDRYNILHEAQSLKDRYFRDAMIALDKIQVEDHLKSHLRQLSASLLNRNS